MKPLPSLPMPESKPDKLRIRKIERNFLGTRWTFVEQEAGTAFWIFNYRDSNWRDDDSHVIVPSSRNGSKE